MGLAFLAGLVLVLGLLMWGSTWFMHVAAARMIGDKHRFLQTIVETGEIPLAWRRPYESRMARLRGKPGQEGRKIRLERKANRYYLQKLNALTRYVESSTLVESEEVRYMLLEKLAEVRGRCQLPAPSDKSDGNGNGYQEKTQLGRSSASWHPDRDQFRARAWRMAPPTDPCATLYEPRPCICLGLAMVGEYNPDRVGSRLAGFRLLGCPLLPAGRGEQTALAAIWAGLSRTGSVAALALWFASDSGTFTKVKIGSILRTKCRKIAYSP